MTEQFDVNKLIQLAKQLGIKVSANSQSLGIFVVYKNGGEKKELFSEEITCTYCGGRVLVELGLDVEKDGKVFCCIECADDFDFCKD